MQPSQLRQRPRAELLVPPRREALHLPTRGLEPRDAEPQVRGPRLLVVLEAVAREPLGEEAGALDGARLVHEGVDGGDVAG